MSLSVENYITANIYFDKVIDAFSEKKARKKCHSNIF